MSDARTIAVYDQRAEDYAQLAADDAHDQQLANFIAAIPQGGCVLDLGCGPGLAAATMARAGLRVDATDAAREMVALASTQAGVTARQASFDDIRGTAIYDGIWANFSLLHASRSQMPRHLAALHRAAKPGARLHIGLKTGTGTSRDRLGRLYTYYSRKELFTLLTTAGFTATHHHIGQGTGLDGSLADWIVVTAHA